MPVISVKMTKEDGGATQEQKDELAKGITELFLTSSNGSPSININNILNFQLIFIKL